MRRSIAPFAFASAVLLLLPFAERVLVVVSRLRGPANCECVNHERARLNIVYLHGLDSYGPSWHEIRSRETLRALAKALNANLAFPRAGGAWPKGAKIEESRRIIDTAAKRCFAKRARFGIIGFSDGGNLANQLYLSCQPSEVRWIVSIGSEGALPRHDPRSLSDCGSITLIAGQHEPTFAITKGFARQLGVHGAQVRFFEHPGPHDVPFEETLQAVSALADRP